VTKVFKKSRREFIKRSAGVIAASGFSPVSWGSEKNDVIVIGAGVSGLYTAHLLEQQGLAVQVIEASDRIGGRLFTLHDVPGSPEAGGQTFGPTYGRGIFLALYHNLNLGKINYALGDEPIRQIYSLGDKRIHSAEQWRELTENPFPEPYRSEMPDRLLMKVMGTPPFASPNDWLSSDKFALDYPAADFLKAKGFSQEAIEMLGRSYNYGDTLESASTLFMHRNNQIIYDAIRTPGGSKSIVGGNQLLPEKMAASLKRSVLTGNPVSSITQHENYVAVKVKDGRELIANSVVCAMPCTRLRDLEFNAPIPSLQREAFEQLTYSRVYQAHFVVETPFWKGKGFLPNVWSDSLIERVFATDPKRTGDITNLTVWINGNTVDQVEKLKQKDAEKLIQDDFYRVLPEARGHTRFVKTHSWQQQPYNKGAFSAWSSGQIAKYSGVISNQIGSIHFAGEHTAQWSSGIEGALESAERAANEVLSKV